MKYSGGSLDNQTWSTEWKTAPMAKVQLCEYKRQTLEAFVAASRLYCQVWLSSGPPDFFTFRYWLWKLNLQTLQTDRQTDRQTDTVMGINPQWSGSDLKMKLRIHVYPPVYTMLTYLHLYWNRNMYSHWALKSNDTPEVGSRISLVAILIPNLFKYPHL